jgi:hypothetical protein
MPDRLTRRLPGTGAHVLEVAEAAGAARPAVPDVRQLAAYARRAVSDHRQDLAPEAVRRVARGGASAVIWVTSASSAAVVELDLRSRGYTAERDGGCPDGCGYGVRVTPAATKRPVMTAVHTPTIGDRR